jgi:hypothetical protein
MEVGGQLHAPVALTPGRDPSTHWIGGHVFNLISLLELFTLVNILIKMLEAG